MKNIHSSLESGGVCLLDMAGKEYLVRIYQPTHSDNLIDGSVLIQRHKVRDNWTRLSNEWILIRKGRAKTFLFHFTVYSGQELMDRMQQAGFADIQLFGSFDGGEYGFNSNRLIAVGYKA